jgi:anti-sigma B factor antagonist
MYPAPEPTSFERTDRRLTVRGDLDQASRHAFWRSLEELLTAGPSVAVNLAGVTFMDATGLAALLRAQGVAAQAGVHLIVEAPSDAVLRILDRTDATALFDIR